MDSITSTVYTKACDGEHFVHHHKATYVDKDGITHWRMVTDQLWFIQSSDYHKNRMDYDNNNEGINYRLGAFLYNSDCDDKMDAPAPIVVACEFPTYPIRKKAVEKLNNIPICITNSYMSNALVNSHIVTLADFTKPNCNKDDYERYIVGRGNRLYLVPNINDLNNNNFLEIYCVRCLAYARDNDGKKIYSDNINHPTSIMWDMLVTEDIISENYFVPINDDNGEDVYRLLHVLNFMDFLKDIYAKNHRVKMDDECHYPPALMKLVADAEKNGNKVKLECRVLDLNYAEVENSEVS